MKEGRSALDRERTKMRERQRRSITTNIFLGLRKHGGYSLSPRADINEVLRHLALEAGWIVEPDGTTYRSTTTSNGSSSGACPLCGGGTKLGAPSTTPSLSFFDGGGGECSTTTSPRHLASAVRSGGIMAIKDTLLAIYMNGAEAQNACAKQQLYVTVPNQETPAGSN